MVNDASGFNTNTSTAFDGKSGELMGGAARLLELRHSDEQLRGRAYAPRPAKTSTTPPPASPVAAPNWACPPPTRSRPSSASTANTCRPRTRSIPRSTTPGIDNDAKAFSLGADFQVSDRLTVGGGVRKVQENAASLVRSTASHCSNGTTASTGYNTGFGISQVGNQTIDPVTGLLVVFAPTSPPSKPPPKTWTAPPCSVAPPTR